MRQFTSTRKFVRSHFRLILPLALIALLAWGCSESPTEPEVASGTGGTTEATADFAAQLNQAVEIASTENGDQSLEFRAELESMVAQSEATEAALEGNAGVPAKGMRSLGGAAQWFWGRKISEPTTITRPGLYVVTNDFATDGDGIVIEASHVLLYLGHHTLTGPGAKEGRGIVIKDARNVVVVGGVLENFGVGVFAEYTKRSLVRWVTVRGADEFADPGAGIAPQIGTMLINGKDNRFCSNSFYDVNLGIFVRGGLSTRNRIVGNHVVGGDHGLLAICYNPAPDGGDAAPHHDLIRFNLLNRFNTGIQFNTQAMYNKFFNNSVFYFMMAVEDLNGTNIVRKNYTEQLESPNMSALTLSLEGLTDLGDDYVYEGWVIVDGSPVTTGTFSIDEGGALSQTTFWVDSDDLAAAGKFVLTIEPAIDPDPAPSHTHYLAGDFSGSSASLTTADPAALGDSFLGATGQFILNTPSTGSDDTDYDAGIWWLDPMAGPAATLSLPELPAGWTYEGWVVGPGGPITTGRFDDPAMVDSDGAGPTSGPDGFPPFPGQDFINPLMRLIGYAAVISIEPVPDNSPGPFALKPLVDGDIQDVGLGVLQDMMNNAAAFPSGSAGR